MASGLKDCPVDAAIVGIVDHVDVGEPRELVGALSAGASAKAEDASPARK
jgi:hypothetical protein